MRRRIFRGIKPHPRTKIEVDAERLLEIEGAADRHDPDVAELSPHHSGARFAQHEDVFVIHVNRVGALHQRKRAGIEQESQRAVDADEHQMVFLRPLPDRVRDLPVETPADQHFAHGIAAYVREGEHDPGDSVVEHLDLRHEAARDHVGPRHFVQLFHADGQERAAGFG